MLLDDDFDVAEAMEFVALVIGTVAEAVTSRWDGAASPLRLAELVPAGVVGAVTPEDGGSVPTKIELLDPLPPGESAIACPPVSSTPKFIPSKFRLPRLSASEIELAEV